MSKNISLIAFIMLISSVLGCESGEPVAIPLTKPEAAVAPQNPLPDVIRLAIYFVQREGMDEMVAIERARVLTQDREAYYISFPKKENGRKDLSDFVVKVYKRNGYAEWSFY